MSSETLAQGTDTLIEAEWIESFGWLISLRWLAGAGVILITLLIGPLFGIQAPVQPLLIIGIAILSYNLLFYLVEQNFKNNQSPPEAYLKASLWQVTLDWLAMTLLIHFSGGIESPVIFFFIFHIVIVATLYPPRIAFSFSVLAVVLLSSIALLEYFQILPHEAVVGYLTVPLYNNPFYVAAILIFFNSTALIVAYLVITISERLRRREREVVQLTGNLQRATSRLQALNEGALTVNSTLELSQVLNSLVKSVAQVLGVRACSIRLLNNERRRLDPVATYGLSQAYLEKGPIDLDSNPLAREVLAGKIVHVPDVRQTTLLQYPNWAVQEGIASMLSAPLIGKNKALGILRAYSEERNHFTSDDETFLAAIAAQGSIAIENAMAYQAIEDLDANKSNFVRMVTHELRSPVSVTRSLLRTITAGYAGEISPQQKDILERASRRADYLQKLIDDLLDMAAGKMKTTDQKNLEPVVLDEVVQRVVNRFAVPAQEKQLSLVFNKEGGDENIFVLAIPEDLDRLFNNLVSNAIKYTLPGGKVSVTLSPNGQKALVSIKDNGIGIPEDATQHLFEEFYRAPNAKEMEREGTGLGLTIVKDIVTRFNGKIDVRSQLGQGTCFTITLPVIKKP
jgi:signal transduction histidine kinase